MSIRFQILGSPGRDNAAYVRIETGQAIHRLLFDCGEGCISSLGKAEIQSIDHLFFSHLHMDHIAGFDTFFRHNYNRNAKPVWVWGPPETAGILHHRFRGFMWNLHEKIPGIWKVYNIHPEHIIGNKFIASEAFEFAHPENKQAFSSIILDNPDFSVQAFHLNHIIPSMGYLIWEKPRIKVNPDKLKKMGLSGGPWLQKILNPQHRTEKSIRINEQDFPTDELKRELLEEKPGDSLAYLTDFLLDESTLKFLNDKLTGCRYLICESQFLEEDLSLAVETHHTTHIRAAKLAREADVQELILFHVSDRYRLPEWQRMLQEAREIFPDTRFPEHWDLIRGKIKDQR